MLNDNISDMKLCKAERPSRSQRFKENWAKRNCVTNIILYGIQVAAILYSLVMMAEIAGLIGEFRDPLPMSRYEDMTIGGLLFRMLSKGWLVGLAVCIVVFVCNLRVIRWNADGILWMFILFFGISIPTLAVESEMFLCFSIFSIGPFGIYFLSLLLPKRIGDSNMTTYQQCRKPKNWLITLSFVFLLFWSWLLCDAIYRF